MPQNTNPPKFLNPFAGIDITSPSSEIKRAGTTLPKWIVNRFRSIRPEQGKGSGTIETTLNLLIIKLINELERRNIKDCTDVTEFERFVTDSVLAMPEELSTERTERSVSVVERLGISGGSPNPQPNAQNDGGRTPSGGSPGEKSQGQPAESGGNVPTQRGGGQGRGRGKGKSV